MKKGKMSLSLVLAAVLLLAACGFSGCEKAPPWENMYTIEFDYLEVYCDESEALFTLLEENCGAFLVDAYNFHAVDDEGTPDYVDTFRRWEEKYGEGVAQKPGLALGAQGYSIKVSRNYFEYNPIKAVNRKPVADQLVMDEYVLNLLVPEKYREYEEELIKAYQEAFLWDKVMSMLSSGSHSADESHAYYTKDGELVWISRADLSVNVIYVKDGQEYFTYRRDRAVNTENRIIDPVVQVYTGNVDPLEIHGMMSNALVFFPDEGGSAGAAYEHIKPFVEQSGLADREVNVKAAYTEEE